MQGRFINVPILKLFLCRFSSYDSNLPLLALCFIVSYCFFFLPFYFIFAACHCQWLQEHDKVSPENMGDRSGVGRRTMATRLDPIEDGD